MALSKSIRRNELEHGTIVRETDVDFEANMMITIYKTEKRH